MNTRSSPIPSMKPAWREDPAQVRLDSRECENYAPLGLRPVNVDVGPRTAMAAHTPASPGAGSSGSTYPPLVIVVLLTLPMLGACNA
jgi:hypothetical protein